MSIFQERRESHSLLREEKTLVSILFIWGEVMSKIEMRDQKHLWITFNPSKGDPREVIIDEEHRDIRICDGKHVVKIMFQVPIDGIGKIKQILIDDVFVSAELSPIPDILGELYRDVERGLSLSLQPEQNLVSIHRLVTEARNNLRSIMTKLGWKRPF
jgi:hypothetical protein